MAAAFERLILFMARAEIPNAATLNPALPRADVVEKAKALRFELAPSVVDLYAQCANGMSGPWDVAQLIPPYRLLALDEAIELRRFWDSLNSPGFIFRPPQLFPIMETDANHYSVACGSDEHRGRVFISHKETTPVPIADSLDALLETATECWVSSIFGKDGDEDPSGQEQERKFRAVLRKHDRGRAEALLASLNAGVFDWSSEGLLERLLALADERAVPALIRELGARRDHRDVLLHALAEIATPETYDALSSGLKMHPHHVRIPAIIGLGRIGDPRAVPALIELFVRGVDGSKSGSDESATVRFYAAWALARLRDPRTVEPVIACLKSEDVALCMIATRLLGQLGDPRALAPLIRMLVDDDVHAATSAAEALGVLGDESAVPHLLGVLERGSKLAIEDPRARLGSASPAMLGANAARALGKIASPRAAGALAIALDDLRADLESEPAERRTFAAVYLSGDIAAALSACGDRPETAGATDFWLAQIDRVESKRHEPLMTVPVRHNHLERLARCPHESAAVRFASELTRRPAQERPSIIQLLARAGAPWAIALFARATNDPDAEVRAAAVEALGEHKVERLRPELELALEDENALVRWQAARALRRIASPSSIPRLTAGLEDTSPAVAAQCACALAAIDERRS